MSTTADIPGAEATFHYPIGDELRGERATLGRSLLEVQRDLRIKAVYISAIENTDPSVFPNASFVPGYVRAYARYLGLDADEVYGRFCADSGFRSPGAAPRLAGGRPGRSGATGKPGGRDAGLLNARASGVFRPDFPLAEPRRRLSDVPLSAVGSLAMLVGLVGALGYGGWSVLQNIQRVQFAPVEEAPVALAELDTVEAPAVPALDETAMTELARPVAATALAELYRKQELEVPILAPRDGPIAGLDPDSVGLLAEAPRAAPAPARAAPATAGVAPGAAPVAAAAAGPAPPAPPGAGTAPAAELAADGTGVMGAGVTGAGVTIVAERAAWVRVYLADDTVIFERILETGETYPLPPDLVDPMIWAGNSGSVYVRVGGDLRGPLGSGTKAVKDVPLQPEAIAERFGVVANVPEAVARAFSPVAQAVIQQ